MLIWTMSCSTLSVIDVGTSTWRQISRSVSSNSIRTVQIWLKLSAADAASPTVFVVGALLMWLMPPVWQPARRLRATASTTAHLIVTWLMEAGPGADVGEIATTALAEALDMTGVTASEPLPKGTEPM